MTHSPKCKMCDDTGFKDYAHFAIEPCDHAPKTHQGATDMDKVTVTTADRDKAADVWRDYVAKAGECIAELNIRKGNLDEGSLVQAFARHRIEATRQAEEQIKLLREARVGLSVLVGMADGFSETDRANCDQALDLIGRIDAALEATNG